MGDAGHVDTACGHVSCHQELDLALAQRLQAAVAQALAQGAVQCNSSETSLLQVFGQAVTFDLGAGKHDRLLDGGITQPMVQHGTLVREVVSPVELLLDLAVLLLRRVDLDLLRLAHDAGSQLLDARRKRGAEHHGLAALGGQGVDFGQVFGKAQVQHAVGFVHHQELHFFQLDLHAALQVQQAARGGYHQVRVLQAGDLDRVRHATHHVGNAQALAMLDQVNRVMGDLLRQFARRAQHQCAGLGGLEMATVGRVLAARTLGGRLAVGGSFVELALPFDAFFLFGGFTLLQQRMQHRQQEGGGLAATGLAGHHQVDEGAGTFVQRQRNRLGLHYGRLGVAQVEASLH